METQKTMVRHLEKRVQQVELDAQEKVRRELLIYNAAMGSFVLFPQELLVLFVFVYLFVLCFLSRIQA